MPLPASHINPVSGAAGPSSTAAARPAVIGVSLKMYFSHQRTLDWCRAVADIAAAHPSVQDGSIELFALPAFPSLGEAARILAPAGARTGAQDLLWEDAGAFTGEVSGAMIAELGGSYAELGHAERRLIFGEDDFTVGRKAAAAYRNGLTPVLCVGEAVRGTPEAAVASCAKELDAVLDRAAALGLVRRTIVAYEPQWAIGAPEPASPSYISEVIRGLDAHLRRRPGQANSSVIYGGSAGPGLLGKLDSAVAGLFLGRFAHDPAALALILDEAAARLEVSEGVSA